MYEIHPVLLTVQRPFAGPLLAVVDDDLVVLAGRDEVGPVRGKVNVADLVIVLLVDLGHLHRADDIIDKLHVGHRRGPPGQPRLTSGRKGQNLGGRRSFSITESGLFSSSPSRRC